MKPKILFIALFVLSIAIQAQNIVPAGFNYQAIARDTLGSPKSNQAVNVKFTITDQFETSTPWVETHSITTDQFGCVPCMSSAHLLYAHEKIQKYK